MSMLISSLLSATKHQLSTGLWFKYMPAWQTLHHCACVCHKPPISWQPFLSHFSNRCHGYLKPSCVLEFQVLSCGRLCLFCPHKQRIITRHVNVRKSLILKPFPLMQMNYFIFFSQERHFVLWVKTGNLQTTQTTHLVSYGICHTNCAINISPCVFLTLNE